jgi:antitoxin PrlF
MSELEPWRKPCYPLQFQGNSLHSRRANEPGERNNVIASKITSKAQTTVPRSVRAALKLGVGDTIVYAIEGDHVIMTKASAPTVDSPAATFDEWNSENDRRAYAGL